MEKVKTFKEAEAVGHVKSLPETKVEALDQVFEQSHDVIDTPDKIQEAIGNAQLDGLDYIEVEERLFKHLVKNSPTEYLTYGKPGIKVFKRGTRDAILKKDNLSAEAYHDYVSRKRAESAL